MYLLCGSDIALGHHWYCKVECESVLDTYVLYLVLKVEIYTKLNAVDFGQVLIYWAESARIICLLWPSSFLHTYTQKGWSHQTIFLPTRRTFLYLVNNNCMPMNNTNACLLTIDVPTTCIGIFICGCQIQLSLFLWWLFLWPHIYMPISSNLANVGNSYNNSHCAISLSTIKIVHSS